MPHHPYLQYLPHPIIPYQHPNFFHHNHFNLTPTTTIFYTHILTPPYSTQHSHFTYQQLHLINQIYLHNHLLLFHNLPFNPAKRPLPPIPY
ncbi:urease accessory protein UreD, partial [Staphylococcus pettenkoferi]|uniref:urease accessory protein UreD n=1 Tax=Staphylococcus pettenkoferi TaxID=170573 RepID=UPI0030B8754D